SLAEPPLLVVPPVVVPPAAEPPLPASAPPRPPPDVSAGTEPVKPMAPSAVSESTAAPSMNVTLLRLCFERPSGESQLPNAQPLGAALNSSLKVNVKSEPSSPSPGV